MQFDFFNDNQNVGLRNDVIRALERCDTDTARAAWQALEKQFPQDDSLGSLQVLIDTLDQRSPVLFTEHTALQQSRQCLQDQIEPAAQRNFGKPAAALWLRARWQELAERAVALAYHPDHKEEHAAPLWLRAGDWQAAADAVDRIASWRRIPAPLAWMLQARLALQGLQPSWGLLAELAWLSPIRLEAVISHRPGPLLQPLLTRFWQEFEGAGDASDLAWFPAWVLTERPALAPHLAQAQAGQHSVPEQAMRLVLELLGLERQGRHHDVIERRKTLRGLHASLYAAYMASR
ncbi:MAG TPA: hypothetical protein VIM63_03230 [Rhodoferax sp.]